MLAPQETLIFSLLAGIQGVGLVISWFTRLSSDTPHEANCRYAFFAALLAVAAVAVGSIQVSPAYVLSAGTTLTVMALMATSSRREVSWA